MVDARGAMPPAPADTYEQPTLRVMRLYKPRLDARRVIPHCSTRCSSSMAVPESTRGEGDFALSSALKLPDSFGNIYLGETFTAYISVLNHMPSTALASVSLSAKLQSPAGRADLDDRRTARGASDSRANPAPLLGPSENLDMIVEHALEELGTHTLRVTVKYQVAGAPEGSEPRSMRKFYRFSVMNPMSLSSTCSPVGGRPFVELQLVNTTQMDLLLDSCDFLPEGGLEASLIGGGGGGDALSTSSLADEVAATAAAAATAIATASGRRTPSRDGASVGGDRSSEPAATSTAGARRRDRWWKGGGGTGVGEAGGEAEGGREGGAAGDRRGDGEEGWGVPDDHCLLKAVERFDGRVLLRPEESHQLMYSVRRKRAAAAAANAAGGEEEEGDGGFGEGSLTLGRVEVCWRTTMGESGCIRSGPVVFEAPVRPEVEVTVDGLPDVLKLGKVTECVATVRNRSGRPMTLQLQFRTDGMVGVYVHGQSFRNLGELLPGASVRCPLQLLALVAGLHELRGCIVADMHTAQEFPQGKLLDILVEFPDEGGRGPGGGDCGEGVVEAFGAGGGGGVAGLLL